MSAKKRVRFEDTQEENHQLQLEHPIYDESSNKILLKNASPSLEVYRYVAIGLFFVQEDAKHIDKTLSSDQAKSERISAKIT